MFDKDMARLLKFTSTGDVRIVVTPEGDSDMLVMGGLGISFDMIKSKKAQDVIKFMSRDYLESQRRLNEEMVIENKEPKQIISDDAHNIFLETHQARSFMKEEFDRYEHKNVCPEDETKGLPIKFMDDMEKLFDIAIKYYYTDTHIVGRAADTDRFICIVTGMEMGRQLQLMDTNA